VDQRWRRADGDLFKALSNGSASVHDRIGSYRRRIRLESARARADVIVTRRA